MIKMEACSPGGWDLGRYDAFEAWARSLKQLGPTWRVSSTVTFIYGLRIRFEQLCTSLDGEVSEDEEEEEPPAGSSFAAGTAALGAIRARRNVVTEADGVEYCDQDPKVSFLRLLYTVY